MKTIRYISVIAAVLAVCSCAKELQDVKDGALQTVTLTAYNGDDSAGEESAKATLIDGDTKVYWCPSDEVKLFCDGVGSRFTSTNTSNAGVATFTGMMSSVINFSEGFTSDLSLWGLYPFLDGASSDGDSVTTTVPSEQSSPAGSFDPKAYVALGKSSSLSMAFYAVCGGIRFSVGRNDIVSVVFSGNNGESLAGEIKITMEEGIPSVAENGKPSREISVVSSDGGTFVPGKYYYAVAVPVTFTNGFTMTFYTADGRQGSYKSTKTNSVSRGVFSTIDNADSYVSSWEDSPSGTPGNLRSGIYLGINAFNQALYSCPMERLTANSKNTFNSFIDNLTSKNGTILYYAADKSLTAMQQASYPSNLCDAVVLTFTDGLDQGSIMMDSRYTSDEDYLAAVNGRLCSEKVAGLPVTAYAIGIRGSDVSDVTKFRNNLKQLSNPESNYTEVSNMSDVNAKFQEIAKKLNQKSYSYKVRLTIPGQANGTKIRFTFDNVSSAASSNLYIEGIFDLGTRSLTDVSYHGLSSGTGSSVAGTVDGIFVSYLFDLACEKEGTTIDKNYIRQWNYVPSTSSWQKNSEFDADEDTDIRKEKHSVALMFVLDCSKSLGSGLSTIQSYVKSFITTLYNAAFDPSEVQGVELDKSELKLMVGSAYSLSANVIPSTAADKSVVWSSSNPSVASVDVFGTVTALAEGSATITVRTVDGGYTAQCAVTVKRMPVPEAVDLGLPSGLKWASFNLGAFNPEDYGGYYQWAGLDDVTDKSIYLDDSNCPYHTGSSSSTGWTKYIPSAYSSYWSGPGSPDNKTVLDPEDDVAHVKLGGKWRMPTKAEWDELMNTSNCSWTWTSNYNGTGVAGRIVTSKKTGYTDKWIFLPAAGFRYYDFLYYVGSRGYYWSSSLNTGGPSDAYGLYFGSGSVSTGSGYRYDGRSVRPVSE